MSVLKLRRFRPPTSGASTPLPRWIDTTRSRTSLPALAPARKNADAQFLADQAPNVMPPLRATSTSSVHHSPSVPAVPKVW